MPYKNKEDRNKAELRRYHKRRQRMVEILGGKCQHCGTQEDLEFDHKDRTLKTMSISRMWSLSWEKLLKELEHCQLLCNSCHIKKSHESGDTAGQQRYGEMKHGSPWKYSKHKCRCDPCKQAYASYRKKYR